MARKFWIEFRRLTMTLPDMAIAPLEMQTETITATSPVKPDGNRESERKRVFQLCLQRR